MNAWRMLGVVMAWLGPFTCLAGDGPAAVAWSKRWVYLSGNLYVDANLPPLEGILQRASQAGYTGVLFEDYKSMTWWTLDQPDRWQANAQRLRRAASALNLELVAAVCPFGRANALLAHDVNLASGLPVIDAPCLVRDGRLVPRQTAELRNGSFEEFRGERAAHYSFQDEPGVSSWIDQQVAREGRASLRFEAFTQPHGHGRICQPVAVQPWQQYRLRAWMKTEHLTADNVQLLVLGGGRTLQYQHLVAGRPGALQSISSVRDLTTEWVEQAVTFNSLENTNVLVYAGVWGGRAGRIWWDDLRLDAVPLLNVLRRDSLPLVVRDAHGAVCEEGRDFERVVDPRLGNHPWRGDYDTRHDPPVVRIPAGSRLHEGACVTLSCYHAAIVYDGQVGCSLAEPKVFDLCAQEVSRNREVLAPDGWFMSHDEIRCGGWEPMERRVGDTAGAMLAGNVARCFALAREHGGGRPVYVWSDMFDPHHNAHDRYFLVNGSLSNSWQGLDRRVVVMKWGSGAMARPGLQFFAARGHAQMIAAYYDGDVAADHAMWMEAARDVPGLIGVMYTTWRNDYAKLEAFAHAWWGGGPSKVE